MGKKSKLPAKANVIHDLGWNRDPSQFGIRLELVTQPEDHDTKQMQAFMGIWNKTESTYRKKTRVILDSKIIPNFSDTTATALIFHANLSHAMDDPANRISKLQELLEILLSWVVKFHNSEKTVEDSCKFLEIGVNSINAVAQGQFNDPEYLVVTSLVFFNCAGLRAI